MTALELINQKIIDKLSEGVNPWRKTWVSSGGISLNVPANYISNRSYTGINFALLDPGYYLTKKQAQELGGYVKDDAKEYEIIFAQSFNKKIIKNEKEVVKTLFNVKNYSVYRIEDCEGIRQIKGRTKVIDTIEYFENTPDEDIDRIVSDYIKREGIGFYHKHQDKAFYQPAFDSITMPLMNQFETRENYYSTLFHEMAHSTGHKKRLDRKLDNSFGSDPYSKEELVAEITATYLMNHFNLDNESTFSNNVAYLKSWGERLKGNTLSYLILSSTTQAEKAFRFIIEKKNNKESIQQ